MNKRVTPEQGPGLDQQRLIRQIQRTGDTRREGLKREADLRVQAKDPSSVPRSNQNYYSKFIYTIK